MKTNTTESATDRTLTVHVGTPEAAFDDVADRLDALVEEDDPDPLYRVTFQRERDLQRVLSPHNIALLRTIAREAPTSIRDLARRVDRDIRQVHDNLSELHAYGIVDFETDGRAKRPVVWYDDIEIEVPIAPDDSDNDAAAVDA